MLHKSFKPAKCKTALNLAKSRLKLMKNKKDMQVKQLKRELAQLLESGQDQTARIRVEHVVREEKTMDAYELIEIYCELIVARLPIIESQKTCPLDLKEAITSLIFAAPRCGDIPELQDIRKHFTAKYGKEFVAAAIELRPACGVSRIMVEKLSVKAPDGPTKVKILTAIAEEHGIKWEPKWFKDEDPMPSAADMVKVQHTEKASMIQMEPLNFEIADDLQRPHAHDAVRPATSSQGNSRADVNAYEVPPSTTSPPDVRRSGSSSERVPFNQSSGIPDNAFPVGRQNWNLEFEDATAAAQAAAESAERASMAARAAAEFSTRSRISGDTSSGSLASSAHGRSKGGEVYGGSVLQQKHVERKSSNDSFNQRSSKMQEGQPDAKEHRNMKEVGETRTFKENNTESGVQSGTESEDYGEIENSSYTVHRDMRRGSQDFLPTQAASNVVDFSSHQEYGNQPAENPFHEETREVERLPSSFQSHTSGFGDEYGIFSNLNDQNKKNDIYGDTYGSSSRAAANDEDWHVNSAFHSSFYDGNEDGSSDKQKYGFDSGRNIFVSSDDRTKKMDVEEIGTHIDTTVVFDDSGSDDDECIFNPTQKSSDLPSPDRSSPDQSPFHPESSPRNCACQSSLSANSDYGLDVSESFRKSPIYSKLSEPLPVTFDSDGEGSGSEKELQNEKTHPAIRSIDYRDPETSPIASSELQESPRSLRVPLQSSDPVPEFQYESQSSTGGGMELNLGVLPGGRRNRSQCRPPYTTGVLGDNSSSSRSLKTAVNNSFDAGQGTSPTLKQQVLSKDRKSTQVSRETSGKNFDSIDNDVEVVTTRKGTNTAEVPYRAKIHDTMLKASPKISTVYHLDDSSSEEDAPKQPVMSKTLLNAGLSRRTKASAPSSVARSKPSVIADHSTERPSNPFVTSVSPKQHTETTDFKSRSTDPSRRDEEATFRPKPEIEVSKEDKGLSSVGEKPMNPPKGAEVPRASNSNEKAPSRENSIKTPRHVHPKLPDFESLTAHLQSLRTNRQ